MVFKAGGYTENHIVPERAYADKYARTGHKRSEFFNICGVAVFKLHLPHIGYGGRNSPVHKASYYGHSEILEIKRQKLDKGISFQ